MESNLKGKVVLITGAASGIGRAAALAFAKEGCRLALVDIDKGELEKLSDEIKAGGADVGSGVGDLATSEGVTQENLRGAQRLRRAGRRAGQQCRLRLRSHLRSVVRR